MSKTEMKRDRKTVKTVNSRARTVTRMIDAADTDLNESVHHLPSVGETGRFITDTLSRNATETVDTSRTSNDTLRDIATAACVALEANARAYAQLVKAQTALTNRVKANQRALGVIPSDFKIPNPSPEMFAALEMTTEHITEARGLIEVHRKAYAKEIERIAKQLPVYPWIENVRGIGPLNLGLIVGATGDLAKYANPAKVWKRMGLAVIDGKRQCRVTDKELAIRMGFSPVRRSIMHIVGDCFVRAASGVYRDVYDARKAYELGRETPKGKMTTGHAHMRALRYTEKRFLCDLWNQWNGREVNDTRSILA